MLQPKGRQCCLLKLYQAPVLPLVCDITLWAQPARPNRCEKKKKNSPADGDMETGREIWMIMQASSLWEPTSFMWHWSTEKVIANSPMLDIIQSHVSKWTKACLDLLTFGGGQVYKKGWGRSRSHSFNNWLCSLSSQNQTKKTSILYRHIIINYNKVLFDNSVFFNVFKYALYGII